MEEHHEVMVTSSQQVRKIRGKFIRMDLTQTSFFNTTWEADAWGRMRTPFSDHLARISMELAASSYDLDIGHFLAAGWTDCTFQLENRVVALNTTRMVEKHMRMLHSEWNLYRAKIWMHTPNPVSEAMRAMQQMAKTDTGKAIVMARPLGNGRAVFAISFIGTSKKIYDWISNLKFLLAEGMHAGFLELARQFQQYETEIQFPETAKSLGLEKLTMQDVLVSLCQKESPYIVWITGHSQGAAVAQTYVHLLRKRGVLDQHLLVYAFASPKVACVGSVEDPADYPIYHILSSDDPVTCVGAQVRLGIDFLFQPDDFFRTTYYGWPVDGKGAEQIAAVLQILREVQSSEAAMICTAGFLRAIWDLPDHMVNFQMLLQWIQRMPYVKQLSSKAENYVEDGYIRMQAHIQQGYSQYAQMPIPEDQVIQQEALWKQAIARGNLESLKDTLQCIFQSVHTLHARHGQAIPYVMIVRKHLSETSCGCWQKDMPARCEDVMGEHLLPLLRPETLQIPRTAIVSQILPTRVISSD